MTATKEPDMTRLKNILLAEDNAKDIELTLTALEDNKLANRVDVVRDGQEAWEYLNRQGTYATREKDSPCLILLDLKMPRLDGIEVLRRLKSDERLKMIPVVMLTTSREERDIVESYKLGVNAYVVKPIDFKDFVEAVSKLGAFWAIINETPQEIENA